MLALVYLRDVAYFFHKIVDTMFIYKWVNSDRELNTNTTRYSKYLTILVAIQWEYMILNIYNWIYTVSSQNIIIIFHFFMKYKPSLSQIFMDQPFMSELDWNEKVREI